MATLLCKTPFLAKLRIGVIFISVLLANGSSAETDKYPVSDRQIPSLTNQKPYLLPDKFSSEKTNLSVTPIGDINPANRITLAIIGDGYIETELTTRYQPMVDSTLDYFFNNKQKTAPYPRYKNFFNIYRIDISSNESGVDDLTNNVYRDTALGGENGCTDYTIGICGANWSLVHSAFRQAERLGSFTTDWRLVMLNDNSYNAAAHYPSEGPLPIYSAHYTGQWDMRDIALHEGAHAWHYLADEYGGNPAFYPYSEPSEVNVTTNSNGTKWSNWLGFTMPDSSIVGAYEGGRYYDRGIYRPTESSKMNGGPGNCHFIGNKCGHNAIAIEKIILDIYTLVDPIDSYTDNGEIIRDPKSISIEVIDSNVILTNWYIDDQLVLEKADNSIDIGNLISSAGSYQISVRAWDEVIDHAFSDNSNPSPLDFVRKNLESLEQTITWSIVLDDNDNDQIINISDNCVDIPNSDQLNTDSDEEGDLCDPDDDNDGVDDHEDSFPKDPFEYVDSDGDGVGDNSDVFPNDSSESVDTDGDGQGNNADADDDGDGVTDEQELVDGTDPLNRFSCISDCFTFDIDDNEQTQALTDGILVIRHLFGLSGESLINDVIALDAERESADDIIQYLTDADSELDIDGDGNTDALTDGLLLLRYLFGIRSDGLITDAVAPDAQRKTAQQIEEYIDLRILTKK
ncbi:MAG: M64 family metallopeptidase [Porticoccaceae bacterium]|nr:M64 family metallopeptidase [Porticoccaceae bacterium]